MIDYPHQESDRLAIAGVPDDIKFLGQGLASVEHWAHKTYDALRRQESPNPTVLNLNPGQISSTTARLRCQALVFSGGTAADVIGLRVGSAIAWDWIVPASPGVFTIPLPLIFDNGVDISVVDITTPAATNYRCRVIAYTEVEDGDA